MELIYQYNEIPIMNLKHSGISIFYMSSVMHIQNTLQEGWELKDSIDWQKYN